MEKFQENLAQAIKNLQIADHMTYITYPLVNEKRLLLKIFDEIYKTVIGCINAILNYECLYKRIKIYKENDYNMQTFINKCAKNYGLTNKQIQEIKEILELNKQHKQSAMEFVKRDKMVILSDNLRIQTINIQKIKEYLLLAKEFLMKVNNKTKLN
jgi:DNA-binding transcriptional MerR regulator